MHPCTPSSIQSSSSTLILYSSSTLILYSHPPLSPSHPLILPTYLLYYSSTYLLTYTTADLPTQQQTPYSTDYMLAAVESVREAFSSAQTKQVNKPEQTLEQTYLTPSPQLSSSWLNELQSEPSINYKQHILDMMPSPTFINPLVPQFKRVGLHGHIQDLELTTRPRDSSNSSLDVTRKMDKKKYFVRGRSGKLPFVPGGIDVNFEDHTARHTDDDGLYDVPPFLERGLRTSELANIDDTLFKEEEEQQELEQQQELELSLDLGTSREQALDDLLPDEVVFVRYKNNPALVEDRKWAKLIDLSEKMDNFADLVPNMARTWPFELDTFQKQAVYHLEQGDSVFVAAHTSAGKTVVAEYAMSMATKHMTKCIYTSPIKALSNQKYRDFLKEYDDVGILTGDVQINPEATTLIMTTEVLRSMLYRGADLIRDVEFVIFDEVHYVNNTERGVVWEEVIIMLPDHVKFILLSATVPNTFEFANWVGRTKQKEIYVIMTPQRPVPLCHNLWARNKLFEILGKNQKKLNDVEWVKCDDHLQPKQAPPPPPTRGRGGAAAGANRARGNMQLKRGGSRSAAAAQSIRKSQDSFGRGKFNSNTPSRSELKELFTYLRKNDLLPCVVFVFSRRLCEQHAIGLKGVDLTTGKQKSEIFRAFHNAVARLRREDRELPQIVTMRDFLTRGIGVHHSGLLPIMKEVVEILFAQGLVKILFATETFAMGLNLPTRTVVFSSLQKYDSKSMRYLTPAEYTQMAGRAGRRGIDTVGTVIILNNSESAIPKESLNKVILGDSPRLVSQFRLTYNMILSLLRTDSVKVEDVIQQSFSENITHVLRPDKQKQLIQLQHQLDERLKVHRNLISEQMTLFVELTQKFQNYNTQIFSRITDWQGRCVVFHDAHLEYAVGLVTSSSRQFLGLRCITSLGKHQDQGPSILPPIPLLAKYGIGLPELKNRPLQGKLLSVTVPLESVDFIFEARNVYNQQNPESVFKLLDDAVSYKIETIKDIGVQIAVREQKEVAGLISEIPDDFYEAPRFQQAYAATLEIYKLHESIDTLKHSVSAASTELLPNYNQRMQVLLEAGYVDEGGNVLLKGRVACEVSTGYELYMTELVLDNFLANYEAEEIIALLSCFVFDGARGVDDSKPVTPKLDTGREKLKDIVLYVQSLSEKYQVPLTREEAEFLDSGRFALMETVYEWARGVSFYEITQITDVQEGHIVRVISRLDEVCRDVMSAARIIGNVDLYDKLAVAQERIKRDIVFCSSLYL